ncbi:copper resistance protein CopC/CopD [Streptomyces roseirectus]|uniref:Copper resistance protein CopC/CopD n=1 Tax=Streptomyces roseirectus TaxID=2768066 RepID=A0A7H0ISX3_9ACTN|nr:copper resistance protein CopC [Streptomyces roseirectus]QNP75889.1 copper resistance protein CopC/CopD [Streptomyces roseirectus]
MLLGTLLVLLLFTGPGPASAHAALAGTDPADGSVVKTVPGEVTLRFTESVGLLDDSIRVLSPENRRVKTGKAGHVPGRSDAVRVTMPSDAGTGTFTVAWRVVSADSHPVSGAFTFSIGEPSATLVPVAAGPTENPTTNSLYTLTRYAAYVSAALLIGTAVFIAVCRPPDTRALRRPLRVGGWTLAGTSVLLLLLRAPYEAGTGIAGILDPAALSRTLTTRPGLALLARLLLLGVLALLMWQKWWSKRATLSAGAVTIVGLALTWAAAEHASAGIQVPLAMTSTVLHLLSMAVWLGGLTSLFSVLNRSSVPVPARVITAFSRTAATCVVVLVVTGVYQSWRGLGSLTALTESSYGRILLAKLAAVVVLLAVGAWSRGAVRRLTVAESESQTRGNAVSSAVSSAVRERVVETVGAAGAGGAEPLTAVPGPRSGSRSDVAAGVGAGAGAGSVKSRPASAGSADEGADQAPDADADGVAGEGEARGARKPSGEGESGTPGDRTDVPVPLKSLPDPGRLTPAEDAHRRALRRSVMLEVVVSVIVLVITTVLTGTLPARAEAEAAATPAAESGILTTSVTRVPFSVAVPGTKAQGTVQITLNPGRVGANSLEAVVYAADGGFATVPELRISFTLPTQDIGPLEANLTNRGGYWAADSLNLPIPGDWTMRVTVRVSEIDQVTVEKRVRIER